MVDVSARGVASGAVHAAAADAQDELRTDIRLLGRVLGDVIRDQAGEAVFGLVERTRVESLRLRREGGDAQALIDLLGALDHRDALHVVRAFSHFSLLANLAEDLDEDRRARRHRLAGLPRRREPSPPPSPGSTPRPWTAAPSRRRSATPW